MWHTLIVMSRKAFSWYDRDQIVSKLRLCILPLALFLLPRLAMAQTSATDSIGFFAN